MLDALPIERHPVGLLRPDPRSHSKRQVRQIAASIAEFGFVNPVLIDERDRILAGHGRLGVEMKLLIEGPDGRQGKPDPSLVRLVVKAQSLKPQLFAGGDSLSDIAAGAGLRSCYFTRLVRLAVLAPRSPRPASRVAIRRSSWRAGLRAKLRFPFAWAEQRSQLGIA
jgi:hypothetical protein